MKSSHSRLGVLILISLLIVGLGITGANAATSSSPSLFKSVTSFFQGLLPTTGYVATGGGVSTCPTERGCVLSVSIVGSGTVTSNPAGISCSTGNTGTCSKSFTSDTLVSLSKTPATGASFVGWSGACSGTSTCNPSMSADRSVTATFTSTTVTYILTVSTAGLGAGTITSSDGGISCVRSSTGGVTGTCTKSYTSGTQITLTSSAGALSFFSGWSGSCTGASASCSITMDTTRAATGTFGKQYQVL